VHVGGWHAGMAFALGYIKAAAVAVRRAVSGRAPLWAASATLNHIRNFGRWASRSTRSQPSSRWPIRTATRCCRLPPPLAAPRARPRPRAGAAMARTPVLGSDGRGGAEAAQSGRAAGCCVSPFEQWKKACFQRTWRASCATCNLS
jgi:hypothetical protein